MTSGATYWGVPQMVCIWLSFIFLASPKSAILTLGMSSAFAGRCSRRFSSLRSRWVILLHHTPTHLSSAGSQSNHLFFIRCSAPAPQLAASCGFSIHLYSNLQAFMHAVQPCPYMKVSLPEYAGQAGRSSLQGSNALCVQVLDAPQQLDKAVARISFIVAATLQHCIQKLPSSQQLCYQVHLRSVHVLLSHSNAFNGLRHDTQALDSRQSRKASQHMHAPNNLRVGM
jgi:hypothetical protein